MITSSSAVAGIAAITYPHKPGVASARFIASVADTPSASPTVGNVVMPYFGFRPIRLSRCRSAANT